MTAGKVMKKKDGRIFLSFPLKVSLLFSGVTLCISIAIVYYLYSLSKDNLVQATQSRIRDMGNTGLFLLSDSDHQHIKFLAEKIHSRVSSILKSDPDFTGKLSQLPEGETYDIFTTEDHDKLYNTTESQSIVQALRKIKAGSSPEIKHKKDYPIKFYNSNSKPFLRYVYILIPYSQTQDHNFAHFILDSDMEQFDVNENGVIDADEESLHIGTLYNISAMTSLEKAFSSKAAECESDFYADQWGNWLSCYIPMFDTDHNFIGVLGLDLDIRSEYNKLQRLKYTLYSLLVILVLGTFLFSYLSARIFLMPILRLSDASVNVARRDFSVEVPIPSNDEVGILTENFNLMVREIRSYSAHLEELVAKRTRELQEALVDVQNLKTKQDGDYMLTSLLIDPLIKNLNKSKSVNTEIYIKQKKEFSFKNKKKEIGGDICITGNLRFLNNETHKIERCVFFCNGDAMGKSLQGAGGALVIGAVLNALLSRSAAKDRIQVISPLQWLKEMAYELQYLFTKFDGSMLVSAASGIINEHTGELIYANFEHPRSILYRNHHASFLEEDAINYKFGFPETSILKVTRTMLQPGDVLILGSDGRDDIILKDTGEMNTDDTLILKIVEKSGGELDRILESIRETGEITDDISFIRVHYIGKSTLPAKPDFDMKSMLKNEKYAEIIDYAKTADLIEKPLHYYYISYAHYRSGNLKEAIKWIEPVKDLLKHPDIQKYWNHLRKSQGEAAASQK
jgi:HAMP domain-containing protein